jgi:hypothetical protein
MRYLKSQLEGLKDLAETELTCEFNNLEWDNALFNIDQEIKFIYMICNAQNTL